MTDFSLGGSSMNDWDRAVTAIVKFMREKAEDAAAMNERIGDTEIGLMFHGIAVNTREAATAIEREFMGKGDTAR